MKKQLKAILDKYNHNQNDLAELLGITYQSVSMKMNGKADFTRSEIFRIVHAYNLTPDETYKIFFNLSFDDEDTSDNMQESKNELEETRKASEVNI